jgi:hypothetical protein
VRMVSATQSYKYSANLVASQNRYRCAGMEISDLMLRFVQNHDRISETIEKDDQAWKCVLFSTKAGKFLINWALITHLQGDSYFSIPAFLKISAERDKRLRRVSPVAKRHCWSKFIHDAYIHD